MDMFALLLVALGATFALCWPVIQYVPLKSKFLGMTCSPKLMVCKLLAPFDVTISMVVILGSLTGLGAAVGISMMVFNVFLALGLSFGVWILIKKLKPKWQKEYDLIKN